MASPTMAFMQFIRGYLLPLPGVTESMHFEDPAFYVNGKMLAIVKVKDYMLSIHTIERDKWMTADPHTFFITPHFINYKYMLVRLETVSLADVKELIITAYVTRATKKLIKDYEEMKLNGDLNDKTDD
ncbi:hypothetical protein SAMN05216464_12175 [Mucilaginibacter pineti]|uniref:MmcQ/YjbR family DNA-binding protein n=1 Tax=Mucilaginibacter pineti TaxID=1391627 RepID=A0A1G7MG65_9SPHI|nr:MmcQ/YjbR family DNA-binding protein [Mucilaginibacter pineti]SDF60701.1 hypothetical protein SAMN05216464_12175 [Mucilaginibacter pineti]